MPGIYPDTPATGLSPAGVIYPGETSLQAAARRYWERKRRESVESGTLDDHDQLSPHNRDGSSPIAQIPAEPRRESQASQKSTNSAERPGRRRSSMSERWHEFKRHLP